MEVIAAICAKISEYLIEATFHQLGYLVSYNNNVNGLKEQLQNLVSLRTRVLHQIDEAKYKAEDAEEDVLKWLAKVDEIAEETRVLLTGIEEETKKNCCNASCFNLVQRHQLSRKAKKLVTELAKSRDKGNFDKISFQAPLPMIENIPGYLTFESRKSIIEGIMEALKDPNISMIGVHGMGGTGKTVLVMEISCQVEKSKLFERVIPVVIGQNPEVKSIQRQLAEMLKLPLDQETEQVRAALLRKRIEMEKKILIVFDDIWNGLDLQRVGIPASRDNRKGCKILVTSRYKDVLVNEMSIEENFELENLIEEESWEFFKNKVNENSIETNHEMKRVATEIVDKCGKLPIALVTLAKALQRKPLQYWKDALRQLKHPANVDIEGVSKEVYASLKLSYDYINSQEAKLLFLLCSMFPEDQDINEDDLSRYALGLGLIQDIETLGAVRDRTLKLVVDLESSYLLQRRTRSMWRKENVVTMHDVVRDVAIYIASTHDQIRTLSYGKGLNNWEDQKTRGNYTAVLVDCKDFKDLPEKLSFPKLELLALLMDDRENKYLRIPECFFEGMEILKVVHLRKMYFSLTPSSLDYLASLQTLLLIDCQLGNIDMIGELKNLEVLDFSRSSIIELPKSIGQLSRLKQLSALECTQLEVIPPQVILRLTKLEELDLSNSFSQWEVGGLNNFEEKNASLSELDHLPCLTRLKLSIPDVKYLPKKAFSKNLELESFKIIIGYDWYGLGYMDERILVIRMDSRNVVLEEGVNMLMKKCEELKINATSGVKDVVLELNRIGCSHLKHLSLSNSEDVEYLMSDFDPKLSCKPFTKLESLELLKMGKLKTIIRGSIKTVEVFKNLKGIKVVDCDKLKYLFPFGVIEALSNLKVTVVEDCEMMEAIVVVENNEVLKKVDKIEFGQLRYLEIGNLPRLKSFCCKANAKGSIQRQSSEIVEEEEDEYEDFHGEVSFPNLEELNISQVKNIWDDQLLPKYNFIKLEDIVLNDCENLKNVFTCNTIKMLRELLRLRIEDCNAVEQVFEMNPNEGDILAFSFKLEELRLKNLPNLNQVWNLTDEDGVEISFPSLRSFQVEECPKIKKLFPTSLTKNLHQLTSLTIFDCRNINEIFVNEELEMEYSKVSFSSLEELSISYVDGLEMIWHNRLIVDDMSKLRLVELSFCKSLKSVFKSNVMRVIKELEYLYIQNCELLEEVFEVHQKLPEEKDEIVTINLKQLSIRDLPNLKQVWSQDPVGIYDFSNLKDVMVKDCPKLKNLFPPSIAIHLPKQLNYLAVDDDGVDAIFMKKKDFIFEKDALIRCKRMSLSSKKVIGESCDHLKLSRDLFPALEVLELNGVGCYKLIPFSSAFDQLLFSIEKLRVSDAFFLEIYSVDRVLMNEENQSRTYSAPLKDLYLRKLPKLLHIWKESSVMIEQIFDNLEVVNVLDCGRLNALVESSSFSFKNLKKLIIHRCHGLRSLFDGLVAKTLVHLKKMELSECKSLTTVVAESKGEAEVDEIVFSELETLKLNHLPALSSFQSTKYTLKFSMLNRLIINKCPEMKMFSRGIISTPFLTCVSVGDSRLWEKFENFWAGNINASIQKLWEEEDDDYGYSIHNLFKEEDLEQN